MPEPRRTTVTLNHRTIDALAWLDTHTGMTQTESMNRAVALYQTVEEARQAGGTVQIVGPDGTVTRLAWI